MRSHFKIWSRNLVTWHLDTMVVTLVMDGTRSGCGLTGTVDMGQLTQHTLSWVGFKHWASIIV